MSQFKVEAKCIGTFKGRKRNQFRNDSEANAVDFNCARSGTIKTNSLLLTEIAIFNREFNWKINRLQNKHGNRWQGRGVRGSPPFDPWEPSPLITAIQDRTRTATRSRRSSMPRGWECVSRDAANMQRLTTPEYCAIPRSSHRRRLRALAVTFLQSFDN